MTINTQKYKMIHLLTLICSAIFIGDSTAQSNNKPADPHTQVEKISEFGKYQGYTEPKFKKWVLHSQYIEMRDGVKLAIDVVRPSQDGKTPADVKVPVIWTHSRYHRNYQAMNPTVKSMVDAQPDLQRLVKHGYAVASVGVRGSGASFGRFEGLFSPNETKDAYEIIDWLAKQDWCTGKVGMFGGSYLGMTQYMAASQNHPALKAIMPNVAGFDMYDLLYPGGVFRDDMIRHWDVLTTRLDKEMVAAKVQTDKDGELLKQAIKGHANNWQVFVGYQKAKHRDTVSEDHSWKTHNPSARLAELNRAKVPCYHWNGFYDIFASDTTLWYANYDGPQKMSLGSWPHNAFYDGRFARERARVMTNEQHRWFDYWLKGIDNGIMDEPPIHYSLLDEEKTFQWKTAKQWPPAASKPMTYYFSEKKSGSIKSVNDGSLALQAPESTDRFSKYKVDPSTTTGKSSRWDNAVGQGSMRYGDMSKNDRKSLTFTTGELSESLTVTGHPVVNLFVSSSAEDANFHVLLEEVDEKGVSHYLTEGVLQASKRGLSKAPWNNLNLPYQRCNKEDYLPLETGEVVELQMDLHPIAVVFNKGHRVRVTIMCADKDNTKFLESSRDADVFIHHDSNRASNIVLPIDTEEK